MAFENIVFDVTKVNQKVNKRSLSFATDVFVKGASNLISAFATLDGSCLALSSGRNSLSLIKALKSEALKNQKKPSQLIQRVYTDLFFYCSLIFVTLSDIFLTITSVGDCSYVVYKQGKNIERQNLSDVESEQSLGTSNLTNHKIRVSANDLLITCSGNFLNKISQNKLLRILSAKEPAFKKAQKLSQEIKAVSQNADFTLLFCKVSDNGAITNLHKIENTPSQNSIISTSHGSSRSSQSSSSLDSNVLTTPSSMRSLSRDSFDSSVSTPATHDTSNDEIESSFQEQESVNEDSSYSHSSSAAETFESPNDFKTLESSSFIPPHSSSSIISNDVHPSQTPLNTHSSPTSSLTEVATSETETVSETVSDSETPENSSLIPPHSSSSIISNDDDIHPSQTPLNTRSSPTSSLTEEATPITETKSETVFDCETTHNSYNDDTHPSQTPLPNTLNAVAETIPEIEIERASPCSLSVSSLSSLSFAEDGLSRLNTPSPSPSTSTLDSLSLSPSTLSHKSFGSSSSSSPSSSPTLTRKQQIKALSKTVRQQIAAIHPLYASALMALSVSGRDENDEDFEVVINLE